jgi:hypothetical protein
MREEYITIEVAKEGRETLKTRVLCGDPDRVIVGQTV